MRHRTREEVTFKTITARSALIETNLWGTIVYQSQTQGDGPSVVKKEISTIDDEHGALKDRHGNPIIRPCSHSSTSVDLSEGSDTISFRAHVSGDDYELTLSGGAGLVVNAVGGLPTSITPDRGTLGSPSSTDWASLNSKFYEACDQYIPNGLLVGEDIVEHGIFVEAVKVALNPSRAVRDLVKVMVPHLKGLLRPTLRDVHDIARRGGDSFLSYQFGLKPAIKDIMLCVSTHQKVESRLQYLRKNRGTFVPIRVRQISEASNTVDDGEWTFAGCYSTWSGKSTRTATISAEGRVRDDINYRGSWAAYAEYFGVQHIVGLAWELIPFSFVVDWVTNAQERIRNLTRLQLGGPFSELRSLCWSEKLTQQFQLKVSPGIWSSAPQWHADIENPIIVGAGHVSQYDRWLTSPDESQVLDFSSLGVFHALATGSLLLQRT